MQIDGYKLVVSDRSTPKPRPDGAGDRKPEFIETYLMVTHPVNQCIFWAYEMKQENPLQLSQIIDILKNECPKARPIDGDPDPDKIYATVFSEDDQWYRCKVITSIDQKSKVQYIDFGNEEAVLTKSIVEIPNTLACVQPLAKRYILYGTKVNPVCKAEEAKKLLAGDQLLKAHLYNCPVSGGDKPVVLFRGNRNINETMVELGYAFRLAPPVVPSLRPPPSQQAQHNSSSDEVVKLKDEMKKLQTEKDQLAADVQTQRGQVRILQGELSNANAKLTEGNLTSKIRSLLVGVNRLRLLRTQFPTDDGVRDQIDHAIQGIVDDPSKVCLLEMPELDAVIKAKNVYHDMQKNLSKCGSLNDLDDLIKERNSARNQLHHNSILFLDKVQSLPLDNRLLDLKDMETILKGYFQSYIDVKLASDVTGVDVSMLAVKYRNWKEKKNPVFLDLRTNTNTCHNAVNSALSLVKKQLDLNPSAVSIENTTGSNANRNLDVLLNRFQSAVNKEIKESEMEHHTEDRDYIAMMLQGLLSQMKKEFNDVSQLRERIEEYTSLVDQLEPWLKDKPDMTDILNLRKELKLMKSKLRHKLADIQDLEESEDANPEELCEVFKELAMIRIEIHELLSQEDKELSRLAKLYQSHFPELDLMHHDLGIATANEFQGLLKKSRDLDQYDIQCANKEIVHNTYFNTTPVVIKEYMIDCPLNEFTRNVFQYYTLQHNNLVPVQALFFSKNHRIAFIQIPHYKQNVSALIQDGTLTQTAIHHIALGALRGLSTLHKNDIVHGSVHPRNVFIDELGYGVLGDYDFSKTLEAEPSTDIYNLGHLLLKMCFPSRTVTEELPDLSALHLEPSLTNVLGAMLSAQDQLSCESLLGEEYFAKEPQYATDLVKLEADDVEVSSYHGYSVQNTESRVEDPPTLQLRKSPVGMAPGSHPRNGILKNGSTAPKVNDPSIKGNTTIKKESNISEESNQLLFDESDEGVVDQTSPEDIANGDIDEEDLIQVDLDDMKKLIEHVAASTKQ